MEELKTYYFDNGKNILDKDVAYNSVFRDLNEALDKIEEYSIFKLWTVNDLDPGVIHPRLDVMIERYSQFASKNILLWFSLQQECSFPVIFYNVVNKSDEDIAMDHMKEYYTDDEINWISGLYAVSTEQNKDISFSSLERAIFCEICAAVEDDLYFSNGNIVFTNGATEFYDGTYLETDGSLELRDHTIIEDPDEAKAYLVKHGYIWEEPFKLV